MWICETLRAVLICVRLLIQAIISGRQMQGGDIKNQFESCLQ